LCYTRQLSDFNHRFMPGAGVMPQQTSQENIINGSNPDAKYGLPGSELRTGAEIPLELAGQNPEAAAQQAIQTLKNEIKSFNGQELTNLGVITNEAARRIGLGPNTYLTLIAREVQSITTPFTQKADELLMSASAKIQEVLSDGSGSTQDSNKPPLGFLGPNTPSKQNPQGPVLAA
jgi:hypothetical protein